jgi:hypothetical protein
VSIKKNFLKFKIKSKNLNNLVIDFYYFDNLKNNKDKESIGMLCDDLHDLTIISWGDFGREFIYNHVILSKFLLVITNGDEIIGYAAVNIKIYNKKKYFYFEFLIIKQSYRRYKLSSDLIKFLMKKIFLKNLLNGHLCINFITITPSPIIIGMISRRSFIMYPNPKQYIDGIIEDPSDETWSLAKEVLANSHNPNRKLEKNGLVLNDSYLNNKLLIYNLHNVPWDEDGRVNKFCDHYLQYAKLTGREFLVIARLCLLTFKRYKKI